MKQKLVTKTAAHDCWKSQADGRSGKTMGNLQGHNPRGQFLTSLSQSVSEPASLGKKLAVPMALNYQVGITSGKPGHISNTGWPLVAYLHPLHFHAYMAIARWTYIYVQWINTFLIMEMGWEQLQQTKMPSLDKDCPHAQDHTTHTREPSI